MNIVNPKQIMVLFQRIFAVFALIICIPLSAQDTGHLMKQEEFTAMLLGNTLIGEWAGNPYKQFFDRGGSTIYLDNDGQRSQGQWRIREDGYYCSVWPPSQMENCYRVMLSGNELVWYSGEDRYPSYVVEGNQLEK